MMLLLFLLVPRWAVSLSPVDRPLKSRRVSRGVFDGDVLLRDVSVGRSRSICFGSGGDDAESLRERAALLREEVEALEAEQAKQRLLAKDEERETREKDEKRQRGKDEEDKARRPPAAAPPAATDSDDFPLAARVLACVPYVLPLSDALPFGRFFVTDFPEFSAIVILPFAPFLGLIKAVPFGGLVAFIALSTLSRNPELPRITRFSMQQAIILDIALIFPQLLGSVTGTLKFDLPPTVAEPLSTTVFLAVTLSILYSVQANLRSQIPNGIPVVSEAAERSIGPF